MKTMSDKISNLTILSFGGGQDSTAILLLIIAFPWFKKLYAPEDLIVVMSDTGFEHSYTYDHVEKIKSICLQEGIPFFLLKAEDGFHSSSWPDLITPQMRDEGGKYKPTMVQLGTKSCTDKLKITPIYKFVDEYLNEKMGYNFNRRKDGGCGKQAFKKFVKENGMIRVLIGFAFGEEKRAEGSDKIQAAQYNQRKIDPKTKKKTEEYADNYEKGIFRVYPLIPEKYDRERCQTFIKEMIGYCPAPSNCKICPYMSDVELIWLFKNDLAAFELWEEIERKKLERESHKPKNYGPFTKKDQTIRMKLNKALEKYADMTDEQINEYKFSHGCTSNAM